MDISTSALRVMNVLWDRGDSSAKDVAKALEDACGWNKNTTYTVIKQCVKKGLIERIEPGFLCHPLASRQQIQQTEVATLAQRLFQDSPALLFSTLVGGKDLSEEEIEALRKLIQQLE